MFFIKKLELYNIVYFKHIKVEIENGITYITGLNKNAKNTKNISNGVGKTLLLSIISNVLFQTPSHDSKKREKSLLLKENSKIVLYCIDNDKNKIKIVQTLKKYEIYINGVEQEFRTIPLAEQWIKKTFLLSHEEYYTINHISTTHNYLFKSGTNSERLTHLINVFQLDYYNVIREKISERLREIRDITIEYNILEKNKLSIESKLSELKLPDKLPNKEDFDKLDRLLNQLQEKKIEFVKEMSIYDTVNRLDNIIAKCPYNEKNLIKYRDTARKKIAQYNEIQAENRVIRSQNARYFQIQERLASFIIPENFDNVKCKKMLNTYEKVRQKYENYVELLEEAKSDITKIDQSLIDKESRYKTILEMEPLLSAKDSKCPICKRSFDKEKIKELIQIAVKKLPIIKEMKRIREINEQLSEYDDVKDVDYDLLIERIKKYKKLVTDYPAYLECKEQLESLSYRDEIECDYDIEKLEKNVKKYEYVLNSIKERRRYPDQIVNRANDLQLIDKKISLYRRKQAEIGKQLDQYNTVLTLQKRYTQDLEEINEKLIKLKPEIKNKNRLEVLEKAYGTKGIRTYSIKQTCKKLEQNLNYYASSIFVENYKFIIECSESGMAILVDRNDGNISDVRQLSGAESGAFNLLFLISLLPLIPSRRRCNFLLLDEPLAHASENWKVLFKNSYLPLLQEVVPAIYITTPDTKEAENYRNIHLIKEGNVTTIQ